MKGAKQILLCGLLAVMAVGCRVITTDEQSAAQPVTRENQASDRRAEPEANNRTGALQTPPVTQGGTTPRTTDASNAPRGTVVQDIEQLHMVANISSGTVTVWLNGARIGDYSAYAKIDISQHAKNGANALRVQYTENTTGVVTLSHVVRDAVGPAEVANLNLVKQDTVAAGEQVLNFTLPYPSR